MSQNFDAYHVWLGIPPAEQPPNYYRLLGLRPFEPNPTVIDNAYQRATAHLQTLKSGERGPLARQLQEEISTAAECLLDVIQKTQYDQKLAQQFSIPREVPAATAVVEQRPAIANTPHAAVASRPRAKRPAAAGVSQTVMAIAGGLLGITLGYFLVYYATGRDLLGLFPDLRKRQAPIAAVPEAPVQQPRQVEVAAPSPQPESALPPDPQPPPALPDNAPPPSSAPDSLPKQTPKPKAPTPAPPTKKPPVAKATVSKASKKVPQPTAEARQKMLAELQAIYKTEFERGNRPDGREEFITFLLETGRKLKSDSAAQYVLYREAFDRALKLEDFATVAAAIDELEQTFDVDGYRLRIHLLTEASKAARTPAERLPLVEFAFALADYAQDADHPEEIAKLVSVIDSHARSIGRETRSKFAPRLSDLRKVAEELVPVVAARQRLANDPADADASLIDGKYRCFVRGDWDAGLKLLAQSNHAALAAAAKQDLAGATIPEDQAAIADLWFDLGTTDPALTGALARARYWYALAIKESPALQRVKLERKLEQIAAGKLPPRLLDRPPAAPPELASARELLDGKPSK